MNESKEKYIFALYEFLSQYGYKPDMIEVLNRLDADLLEIVEMYFHDDSDESNIVEYARRIIGVTRFHTQRFIDNETLQNEKIEIPSSI